MSVTTSQILKVKEGWKEEKRPQAIVLVGGMGSRLFPFTTIIPKALMPVNGVPIIRKVVDWLALCNFQVILCVNKRYEKHFRHEFRYDHDEVTISVSNVPLGTAGEVYNTIELIEDDFLLVYGDTYANGYNFKDFYFKHQAMKNSEPELFATLLLTKTYPLEFGYVETCKEEDMTEVVYFKEKPEIPMHVWTGIAVLDKSVKNYLYEHLDFARDIFPEVLRSGKKIRACFVDEYYDVGNIRNYQKLDELMKFRGRKE